MSTFLKLGDYFFLEPKKKRVETNLIGLVVMDISRLYDFIYTSVIHFESKIIQVDDAFSLSLYDLYSTFIRVSRNLEEIFPK